MNFGFFNCKMGTKRLYLLGLPWGFNMYIFLSVYLLLRDRERQSVSRGGAEREGDTESEAGSRLWAVSTEPDVGLELTDREIMTWAEVGRLTDWDTQAPLFFFFFFFKFIYFEREREWVHHAREQGRDRERIQSRNHATGVNSWTVRSWPEPKLDT